MVEELAVVAVGVVEPDDDVAVPDEPELDEPELEVEPELEPPEPPL